VFFELSQKVRLKTLDDVSKEFVTRQSILNLLSVKLKEANPLAGCTTKVAFIESENIQIPKMKKRKRMRNFVIKQIILKKLVKIKSGHRYASHSSNKFLL